jgi:hypothetical protein
LEIVELAFLTLEKHPEIDRQRCELCLYSLASVVLGFREPMAPSTYMVVIGLFLSFERTDRKKRQEKA